MTLYPTPPRLRVGLPCSLTRGELEVTIGAGWRSIKLSLRDLCWLIVVAAFAALWLRDRIQLNQLAEEQARAKANEVAAMRFLIQSQTQNFGPGTTQNSTLFAPANRSNSAASGAGENEQISAPKSDQKSAPIAAEPAVNEGAVLSPKSNVSGRAAAIAAIRNPHFRNAPVSRGKQPSQPNITNIIGRWAQV